MPETTTAPAPIPEGDAPASALGQPAKTPPPNPREAQMNAIVDKTTTQFYTDNEIDIDADPDDAAAKEARAWLEQGQLNKQLAEPSAPGLPAATVLDKFDGIMVKTKVDGEEVLRPLTDIVRVDQKDAAATRRLQEAERMREEAAALLARIQAQATPATPASPEVPASPAPSSDAPDIAAMNKDLLAAIYAGEEDKALELLNRINATARPPAMPEARPAPDPEAIAAQVMQQLDRKSALDKFAADYPEILADPYLSRVADGFLDTNLKEGIPFGLAVAKAGADARDWVRKVSGVVAPPPAPTVPGDRLLRKQTLDQVPAIAAPASAAPDERIPTNSELIAEMRAAREGRR